MYMYIYIHIYIYMYILKTPTAGHRRTPTQAAPTQSKRKFPKVSKLCEVISP